MSCECLPGSIVVECLDDGVTFVKVLDSCATACRSSIDGATAANGLTDCGMAGKDIYAVVAVANGMDDGASLFGQRSCLVLVAPRSTC